jgi:hypothetical protein
MLIKKFFISRLSDWEWSEMFIVSRKDNLRVACISKKHRNGDYYFDPGYDLGATRKTQNVFMT